VAFGAEYPLAIDYTPEKGGDPVTAGFLYFTESLRKGAPAYMIGYHLDPEYQGMGIATQALQMFCHMVWAHSGGGRSGEGVFALVYKENIKSIKLLERCGFRRDSMYCILREVRGRVLTELRYYR
jgi:RimJ/RimL family protein N-acetyltransferase